MQILVVITSTFLSGVSRLQTARQDGRLEGVPEAPLRRRRVHARLSCTIAQLAIIPWDTSISVDQRTISDFTTAHCSALRLAMSDKNKHYRFDVEKTILLERHPRPTVFVKMSSCAVVLSFPLMWSLREGIIAKAHACVQQVSHYQDQW